MEQIECLTIWSSIACIAVHQGASGRYPSPVKARTVREGESVVQLRPACDRPMETLEEMPHLGRNGFRVGQHYLNSWEK